MFRGSPLLSLTYHSTPAPRDNLGRVATKTQVRAGVTTTTGYTYDPMGRLYQVRTNGTLTEQYTYDDNGNRLTGLDAGATSTATYDEQDRLKTYGNWTYTYTANGELATKSNSTSGDEWTYDYDVMGNLRSVTLPDDRVVSYQHDGRNRRIAKFIDGIAVRRWIYGDQLNPVLELDGNDAPLFRYVYASMAHSPDYIIAANGANYRVLRDQLGSPLLIVNTTNVADVMLNASYSAFGRRTLTSSAGVIPTLGFAGGIYDEDTELTRFGARDYDAAVGRWTAKDPMLFGGGDANLFAYAGNEPVNWVDPSGLVIETAWDIASVVMDIASLHDSITCGSGLDIALDSGALALDLAAAIIPGIPAIGAALRGAKVVDNALDGLAAGRSAGVKVVQSEGELRSLFDSLSSGGKLIDKPRYPGKLVELDDATTIGLRESSLSGGPTIDVTMPGGERWKIHIE